MLGALSGRPWTVTATAAIVAAEAVAVLGFGAFVGWETVAGKPLDTATAIGVTAMALIGGVCMLAVARGLLRADRWSRSPTVLTQLLALPIAWSLLQSGQHGYGVPLIVLAVLALILVLTGPSTTWLTMEDTEPDEQDGE